MNATRKDRQTIEAIKRQLDHPETPEADKLDLREEWDSIGQNYAMVNMLGNDEEYSDLFLSRVQGAAFIRHGESEGNAGLPTGSPSEIRLTSRGHHQAESLAKSVTTQPDLIVVSPFLRTQQTAEPLIGRCVNVPLETWEVQEFTYLNPFNYVGTTEAERSVFVRAYWERCDHLYKDGGGAESFLEFINRIDDALARLRADPKRWTLVFSHGYFIKGVLLRAKAPTAPIDSNLMKEFREVRKGGVLDNCKWLVLDHI